LLACPRLLPQSLLRMLRVRFALGAMLPEGQALRNILAILARQVVLALALRALQHDLGLRHFLPPASAQRPWRRAGLSY
jgi:hypothetical protein